MDWEENMKCKAIVIGLLLMLTPWAALAGVPMETVEKGVSRVLEVASDPKLEGEEAKPLKVEKIKSITAEFFDYQVLSRLTLGRHWRKLSPEQQNEFVGLYRSLLEKVYMDRILAYSNEKVEYVREVSLSESKSEVQTLIIAANKEIPIDYRLYNRDGTWKVYDVVIEGVSMVSNYRSQFESILQEKTPEDMLEVLRGKVNES
jgi:phospholipid transport system substrate-binding protein